MTDPYVGKLTYFRVYSGQLKAGIHVYNATQRTSKERIGRILQMHANHREERDEIGAGEIAAARRPQVHHAPATRSADRRKPILLESIVFPEPVIEVAVEPKTKADQDKLAHRPAAALRGGPDLPRAAPTRRPARRSSPAWASCTSRSSSTACMREFKVDANVGKPQVAYRETISAQSQNVEGRFVRQTGGRGQYGHVGHRSRAERARARATSS